MSSRVCEERPPLLLRWAFGAVTRGLARRAPSHVGRLIALSLAFGTVAPACESRGVSSTGPVTDVADSAVAADVASDEPGPDGCVPTFTENDPAACADGIDNDCNGRVDCADTGCSTGPGAAACTDGGTAADARTDAGCVRRGAEDTDDACSDGLDNDCNGYTDCRDFACSRSTTVRVCCTPTGDEATDATCGDGADNDCDGFVDCRDFSCSRNPSVTVCRPPCTPSGPEGTDAACSDGVDNDCNGYTDCVDFACSRSASVTVCRTTGTMPTCAVCRSGSECAGGVCATYNDQPALRFCTRRCTTDGDCASTTLTRCAGGICVTANYAYACAAGNGSYSVRDVCGLQRTYACTSPERCAMVGARAECAPPATCRGTPTECGARTVSCGGGCSSRGSCSGSARSCDSYLSSGACRQQDGCNWSGSLSNECRGSANSCSSYSSEGSCSSQDRCSWSVRCSGAPTACSTFTTSANCASQPGCRWL